MLSFGQETTGRILGTVTDETGGVVPGAKVVATSPSLPRGLESTSDDNGNYTLFSVPIGTYTVTVSKEGFATVRQNNVVVTLGAQLNYNPKLAVGQVTQIVEVTDAAVSLDTTSSRTSTNITQQQFEDIPKSRNFHSLLQMAPGVRMEVKGGNAGVGGIQVDGASGSENAYIIDGVDVSDVRRGSLRQQNAIPFEFVQEVQVKSGGFEAEFGGATGGVVNVATRGGSNEFHGQAYLQYTGDGLNASDRGYYQASPLNANLADFFKPKEDDYKILYPGFALGGRLVPDRLFFFASLSPELEKTTRTIDYTGFANNAQYGKRVYEQEEKRWYGMGRLDYQPSQKLQLNSTYLWSPRKQIGTLQNRDIRVAPVSDDRSKQGGYQPANAFTASATYTVTPNFILSGRYGYRYMNDKIGNYGLSGSPFITYLSASSSAGQPVPADVAFGTNYTNVTSTLAVQKDITTRNNVYLDGTYIAGRHTVKAGYYLARLYNDVLNDYTNGRFTVNWGEVFSRGSITNQRGTYGYYRWEDGVTNVGKVSSRNQGFYIQDAWRVNSRLTVNAGVRFENEFLPPFQNAVGGITVKNPISFDWGSKIAPRLGAAWDVLGDGKWKVAGSFGMFYDVLKYELARGSFGSDHWVTHVYRLDNPNVFQLSKANPGVLGSKITQFDNRTLHINERGEIDGIDPDIKPYQSREFSVSVDRQLAPRLVAGVRYARKDLLRVIEDIGSFDADENEVYVIGNPGFGLTSNSTAAKTPNGKEFLVPKAVRQYDGIEFRIQGNVNRAFFLTSYTWSRLYGNYSGAANSDESGRSDPGVSRAFDSPFYYFDASGSQRNVLGLLGTDRPHTFKFFGSYDLSLGRAGTTTIGLTQLAYSGTPDSTTVLYFATPTFPYGRGDMGRTPTFTQTDIALNHNFKMTERTTLRFEFNVQNLFNQGAVISRTTQMSRGTSTSIPTTLLPTDAFFRGYDPLAFVKKDNTGAVLYNPIYGLPGASYRAGGGPGVTLSSANAASLPNFGAYQDFRTIRLGVRFLF